MAPWVAPQDWVQTLRCFAGCFYLKPPLHLKLHWSVWTKWSVMTATVEQQKGAHPKQVGKYEVEQFLGGGMSHVYRAIDPVLGRRVAVKVLTEKALGDPEARAKFLQEARVTSTVHHENIVSIFDFGEDSGRPFIVMEFVEGESLRAAIEHGRAGDVAERTRIAREAARALAYVHSLKLVHRDIKPENIHIDRAGKVRLMDFGIAAASGEGTKEGSAAGTPFYMAPEQALGRPLTAQADVYSFGVVLYELFTGKKPFVGESVEKIFEQVIYKPIDPEPLAKSGAPQTVQDVIAKCTAKKLMERPATMAPVYDALEKALAPQPKPAPSQKDDAERPETYVRLRMLPPPDPNAPPAPKIAEQKQNATPQAAAETPVGTDNQGNQMKSLMMAAVGAVVVAFLIYVVVRLSGNY